jgi:hypothetical protein
MQKTQEFLGSWNTDLEKLDISTLYFQRTVDRSELNYLRSILAIFQRYTSSIYTSTKDIINQVNYSAGDILEIDVIGERGCLARIIRFVQLDKLYVIVDIHIGNEFITNQPISLEWEVKKLK